VKSMNSTKSQLHQEMKRKIVLEELIKLGVYTTKEGKNVYDCDYDDLKHELVIARFRQSDRQNDEGKWF
jgi:hypothetical protein